MQIEYYGPRGSLPTPGKGTVKYGGNTTCLSIRVKGQQFIVDAGSGVRVLGNELMQKEFKTGKGTVIFFWTHFHWDHLLGFPFFVPNFIPGNKIIHYGSARVQEILTRQQDFITFPVEFKQIPSEQVFHTMPEKEGLEMAGLRVDHCPNNHPAGGYIFKFSQGGKSFVFATDTEHPEQGIDQNLLALCQGADLLIYDAQYTPEEYQQGRKGWGHSTWEKGVELAKAAKVKTLHLTHHDQLHSDQFLERKILAPAKHAFPRTYLAREGWEFTL